MVLVEIYFLGVRTTELGETHCMHLKGLIPTCFLCTKGRKKEFKTPDFFTSYEKKMGNSNPFSALQKPSFYFTWKWLSTVDFLRNMRVCIYLHGVAMSVCKLLCMCIYNTLVSERTSFGWTEVRYVRCANWVPYLKPINGNQLLDMSFL